MENKKRALGRGLEQLFNSDNLDLDQIEKQLFKLEEVITIEHCDPSETVLRETALIKVSAPPEARVGIIETANISRYSRETCPLSSFIIYITKIIFFNISIDKSPYRIDRTNYFSKYT